MRNDLRTKKLQLEQIPITVKHTKPVIPGEPRMRGSPGMTAPIQFEHNLLS
jgi:hypothetical protein